MPSAASAVEYLAAMLRGEQPGLHAVEVADVKPEGLLINIDGENFMVGVKACK